MMTAETAPEEDGAVPGMHRRPEAAPPPEEHPLPELPERHLPEEAPRPITAPQVLVPPQERVPEAGEAGGKRNRTIIK